MNRVGHARDPPGDILVSVSECIHNIRNNIIYGLGVEILRVSEIFSILLS